MGNILRFGRSAAHALNTFRMRYDDLVMEYIFFMIHPFFDL